MTELLVPADRTLSWLALRATLKMRKYCICPYQVLPPKKVPTWTIPVPVYFALLVHVLTATPFR